jgi:hypothetical protein
LISAVTMSVSSDTGLASHTHLLVILSLICERASEIERRYAGVGLFLESFIDICLFPLSRASSSVCDDVALVSFSSVERAESKQTLSIAPLG